MPLLYQQGACIITNTVQDINWRSYKLQQPKGSTPVGDVIIAVHVASVWIPYENEAKESIAHYDEIASQIKYALQECGRKLKTYINRKARNENDEKRLDYLKIYPPYIAKGIRNILSLTDKDEIIMIDNMNKMMETK